MRCTPSGRVAGVCVRTPEGTRSVMPDRAPDPRMLAALKKAVGVLQEKGIPFALAGSMACWALGGPPSRQGAGPECPTPASNTVAAQAGSARA